MNLPFSNELFTYEDIGVSFPTVTVTSEIVSKTIIFDPTAAGTGVEDLESGGRRPGRASRPKTNISVEAGEDKNVFYADEYNFVVQMAWTPRNESEISAAREARVAAEQEAAAAAAEEAGELGEQAESGG